VDIPRAWKVAGPKVPPGEKNSGSSSEVVVPIVGARGAHVVRREFWAENLGGIRFLLEHSVDRGKEKVMIDGANLKPVPLQKASETEKMCSVLEENAAEK